MSTETMEQAPAESRYLVYLRDVPQTKPGLTRLDVAHPPECPRGHFSEGERTERFDRHPDEMIGRGWAVGRDAAGLARVFLPAHYGPLTFLGFSLTNASEGGHPRLYVVTRGRYLLRVAGLTEQAIGAPVYVTGPNAFTVTQGTGGEVGIVAFVETPGWAAVSFKRFDDHEPFDQNLMRVRER